MDNPLTGLRIRDNLSAERSDAHIRTLQDIRPEFSQTSSDVRKPTNSVNSGNDLEIVYITSKKDARRFVLKDETTTTSTTSYSLRENDDDNDRDDGVFTVDSIAQMKGLEERLVSIEGFEDYCLWDLDSDSCSTVLSPVRYLENATTQEEIDDGIKAMWLDRNAKKDGTLLHFCRGFVNPSESYSDNATSILETTAVGMTKNATKNTVEKCTLTKTLIKFGLPLKGYLNENDRREEQLQKLDDWLWKERGFFQILNAVRSDERDSIYMTFYQNQMINREVLEILEGDAMLSVYSIAAVFIIMVFHLQSFFLATLALIQILISFTVCFFLYRVVLGIELFGGLNFVSLYLLLGIGCDDIFIFTDALKQSPSKWTFERRLGWAFSRAAYTMATTTTTTGFAFLMLAISEIPIIRYFGIYTALLLFVNLFMVCTLYTCALVLWHDHFDGGKIWFPTLIKGRWFAPRSDDDDDDGDNQSNNQSDDTEESSTLENNHIDNTTNIEDLSRLERFFKLVYARRFINTRRGRIGVITVAAVLAVASIGLTSQLEIAKEPLLFWRKLHPFGIYLRSRLDGFEESRNRKYYIKEVYGLEYPFIDRTGTKETKDLDFGVPIYDTNFDLASPFAQEFLRDSCLDVVNNKTESLQLIQDSSKEEIGKCVMVAFALWREARNESFPVRFTDNNKSNNNDNDDNNIETGLIADSISVPSDSLRESFTDLMLEFLGRPQFGSKFFANVGFRQTSQGLLSPKFLTNDYAAEIEQDDPFFYRTRVKKAWDAHMRTDVNAKAPSSLGGQAYYTDSIFYYFVWQRTQSLFLSSTLLSIGLSLTLAFILTSIATWNWILASITCMTISLVLLNVFAVIAAAGMDIGAIESTLLTLVIGVSVDYQLHLVIGYSDGQFEAKIQDREGRCEHALGTVGSSVLAGSITTIISTSLLLFATIAFFSQFAFIMVVASLIALIYGLVVLPVLLSTIGPQNDHGTISLPSLSRCGNISIPYSRASSQSISSSSDPASIILLSKKRARSGILGYFALIMIIGAITAIIFLARSDQTMKEEKERDQGVLDATYSKLNDDSIFMPNFDDLVIGEWNEFRPGNDTICARGTPYAFFVRRGEPGAPMIVELQGGGSCWNPSTCQKATGTFFDTVEDTRASFRRSIDGKQRPTGMFDEEGPYQKFTYVYIPYCTGDLHWGNSTIQYSDTLTIRHKGWVNAHAVLNYVRAQIPAPPRVLVTGCSAGAYGSWLWAQWLSKHYQQNDDAAAKETRIYQMGDSGMGVVTDSFLSESFSNWNFFGGGFPDFIVPPEEESLLTTLNATGITVTKLFEWGALKFTNSTFGQASSAYDWNQAFFYKTMKEGSRADIFSKDKVAWNEDMNTLYDDAKATRPANLVNWVAPGDYHCVLGPRHYYADFVGVPYYKRLYNYFMKDIINDVDCRDISNGYCKQGVDLREDIKLL